jgi:hypothetical protein
MSVKNEEFSEELPEGESSEEKSHEEGEELSDL